KFFDVHTHTQDSPYESDRDLVIRRALDAGIGMVQVGTDFSMSQKAIELAERYENVYATVGLHPTDNTKEEFDYEAYKKLALSSNKVVAVGECGLDYFRMKPFDDAQGKQKDIFIKQIELAKEIGKPLMIHCREAFPDLIEILKENIVTTPHNPPPYEGGGRGGRLSSSGVVHFFSGSVENAKTLLDMGFYFSFGGVITFTRDYDEQIKFISLDKILLETDAPYVAPVPYRGKRNEPLYVIEVAKKISEIKGATLEEVARETTKNALSVFGIFN
ncbi:MAG: TatD family hydrolase, partial [Patescibacteria group bacterium]